MLKLFRDYVFHGVTEEGRPFLDMSHVVQSLNKLDSGSSDKVRCYRRRVVVCPVWVTVCPVWVTGRARCVPFGLRTGHGLSRLVTDRSHGLSRLGYEQVTVSPVWSRTRSHGLSRLGHGQVTLCPVWVTPTDRSRFG